jgi:membrane-associated phospholipid phosphatase
MPLLSKKDLWNSYKHLLLLLYDPIILFGFFMLERIITVPKYVMHTRIDELIPFIPAFIIPYCTWYAYIVLTVIYTGLFDKKNFINFCAFMYTGMTSCFILYVLFPNGQDLRPTLTQQGFLYDWIRHLYKIDTPTNSIPSIHVINSMAVYFALKYTPALKDKKAFQACNLTVNVLIILSTMAIKQHSILDVVAGMAFAVALWFGIYRYDLPARFIVKLKEGRAVPDFIPEALNLPLEEEAEVAKVESPEHIR